ncbi:hypothetical protein GCM10022243_21320 [Saccharothrix violaceirubra]|uniref:Uncharacterized protein (DUF58 family) n=1 Tax=Saccharothrix violaceirubra TaxID=413306 RepID=A0A7W7T8H1_9PSEU|nr:DUF58 domain-containing protein [Saccharothrix violaceirubra]MBB4968527.1 uncharacterized protein (DUF58 family) [Saccharothrix violaceirubra]
MTRWQPTDALVRGLALGVGLVVFGLVLHKVALVLFGTPLLLSTLIAIPVRGRRGTPRVSVRGVPRTGEIGAARAVVELDAGEGAEVIAVRVPDGRPGLGPVRVVAAGTREVEATIRRDAWGEGVELRPDHLAVGPDALLVYGPVTGVELGRVVLPPVAVLPAGLLPARASGLVGAHRAWRPGDSTELRDIRAFQPGDRLKRIDWRVSLRSGGLHVREHHAEADADVVLALDTRLDVGTRVGEWAVADQGVTIRPGGSLDVACRAAASLAAGYLRQGDRVGLVDLGRPQLGVRAGAGRRQLLRLRNQLVVCARSAGWAPRPVLAHRQVPHGALVVVLSPFLDAEVVEATVHAARRGNVVLAVDALPAPLVADPDPWGAGALAVIAAEHEVRLEAMRRHGVAVVRWDGGGGSIAGTLRQARSARRTVR